MYNIAEKHQQALMKEKEIERLQKASQRCDVMAKWLTYFLVLVIAYFMYHIYEYLTTLNF